jgi:sugar phosphate isomerase/epimerase
MPDERIGVERLCVFGLPPIDFVKLAADLDCRWVGTGLEATGDFNPYGYPDWSLRTDAALRRATVAAMNDNQVAISVGEGFRVGRDSYAADYARNLEIFSELGCRRINVTSSGRDFQRSTDGLAVLAELAATYGVEVVFEVGSGPLIDVATAARAAREINQPNLKLLLDTMHFFRWGSTLADLKALDPQLIGYVQLCDVPLVSPYETYMEEAMYARLPPGEGELPLADFLRLIPADVIIGLEIPQRDRQVAGEPILEIVETSVTAARTLLADLAVS